MDFCEIMSDIRINHPQKDDVERMFSLLKDSMSRFLYINENSESNKLIIDRRLVEEYVSDSRFYTINASLDSQIIGWLSGSNYGAILADHSCAKNDFYIEEIVVDSRYRRRGIGSQLIEKIPRNSVHRVIVDVLNVNNEGVNFYLNLGFKKINVGSDDFLRNWKRMAKSS